VFQNSLFLTYYLDPDSHICIHFKCWTQIRESKNLVAAWKTIFVSLFRIPILIVPVFHIPTLVLYSLSTGTGKKNAVVGSIGNIGVLAATHRI
jgi:hypothetical protein